MSLLATVLLAMLVVQGCIILSTPDHRNFILDGKEANAMLCRPAGRGFFPAVVYSHGRATDSQGFERWRAGGLIGGPLCQRLAADGFLAFVSTRDFYSRDGRENIPRNLAELLHMGISIRHILVDQNDAVIRLSNRLFQRLWDNSQGDTVPQFAGCRVRWAEAVVELKDRKPVDMLRVVFSYLYFDDQGHLDRDKVMQNGALMIEAGIEGIAPSQDR